MTGFVAHSILYNMCSAFVHPLLVFVLPQLLIGVVHDNVECCSGRHGGLSMLALVFSGLCDHHVCAALVVSGPARFEALRVSC